MYSFKVSLDLEKNPAYCADLKIVTPEPAHILNDNALDLARLDVGKHSLESGPVEVGSRISVAFAVEADGCIAVIPAILFPNPHLERDLSRVFCLLNLHSEACTWSK